MTMTMIMHWRTYGGAVSAFDTKTLKWKDLITVGRSRCNESYAHQSFPLVNLQVPSGLVGVRVMFANIRWPHSPRSVAASLKSARATRFLYADTI
jgi:hypothetical protein